jgi:tetratricopeptide (TPR) repeat protein
MVKMVWMRFRAEQKRQSLLALLLTAAAAAALLLFPATSHAQAKKPITREGLVKAVRINGLSTVELIQQVQLRGVSFQMTSDAEAELRAAGARPEVIEAARANYRPSSAAPVSNAGGRGGRSNVPAGPPLSKNEIVTMLQAGTPSARVEQFVDARGVNFQSNAQTAREIKAAGGANSLVGAVTAAYTPTGRTRTPPPAGNNRGGGVAARGPDYDDLTDQATSAFDARDAARATQLLSQAIRMEPASPRAYQLLGFTQLYLQGNISEAEKNMRKAIELGGSAAFRVFHDHANGSFSSTCSGTLFVTRTNVTYKADDGKDTFEAEESGIKEIKINNFAGGAFGALLGGKDLGAFHIKVKRGGDSRNYNFAPLTKKKNEAELIITLVKGYGGAQG